MQYATRKPECRSVRAYAPRPAEGERSELHRVDEVEIWLIRFAMNGPHRLLRADTQRLPIRESDLTNCTDLGLLNILPSPRTATTVLCSGFVRIDTIAVSLMASQLGVKESKTSPDLLNDNIDQRKTLVIRV